MLSDSSITPSASEKERSPNMMEIMAAAMYKIYPLKNK